MAPLTFALSFLLPLAPVTSMYRGRWITKCKKTYLTRFPVAFDVNIIQLLYIFGADLVFVTVRVQFKIGIWVFQSLVDHCMSLHVLEYSL